MIYQNAELHNIAALIDDEGDGGKKGHLLCRIPLDLRAALNDNAYQRAIQTPGAEVRFNLAGKSASLTLQMTEKPATVEVYAGPFLTAWHVINTRPTKITITPPENLAALQELAAAKHLPFDPALCRVILPWRPPVRLRGVRGKISPPAADQVPAVRYLAYGSSITNGNSSIGPGDGYAARVARRLGVDLINLGFGGGAHCEAAMAEYIAGRDDWDFASLELGINLIGSLDPSEFAERARPFIETIARAHPDKWIFCIDMFTFGMDFQAGESKNRAFREIVRQAVRDLHLPRLVHLDGRDLLKNPTGLTADLVHPSPGGMGEIAANLAWIIENRIPAVNGRRLLI